MGTIGYGNEPEERVGRETVGGGREGQETEAGRVYAILPLLLFSFPSLVALHAQADYCDSIVIECVRE
jgi:hypothetical protein